jgi:hypothetical protein
MANLSVSGKLGTITGVTGVTEISDWNVSIESEALDATSKNSQGWKEHILGLQSASGSIKAFGNAMPPLPTDAIQTVTLALVTDADLSVTITAEAILSNIDVSSPMGVVEFSADFTFTGEVVVS